MGRPAVSLRLTSALILVADLLSLQLDAARYLIEATQLPLKPQELLDKMDVRLLEAFSSVEVLPGVLKLVKHLAAHNVPMAVSWLVMSETCS